jgi:dihydroorotase
VHDLATTMTKLLACGMPLEAVVAAVTDRPRRVLRMPESWLDPDGAVRHATVFRLSPSAQPHRYTDATGTERTPAAHIVPVATVAAGRLSRVDPGR